MEIKLYTLLILLGTYSHIKIECCYKISANGKSICEGRAKLDEKFNFDRTKQIAFSDC